MNRYLNESGHRHVSNCLRVGVDGTVCVYLNAASLVVDLSAVYVTIDTGPLRFRRGGHPVFPSSGHTLMVTSTAAGRALPHDDRPVDPTPVRTDDLPATPVRDRRIPASAWTEAPAELLALAGHAARLAGTPDGEAVTSFLRRIGPWLLWRAGPARGPSICWAGHVDDLSRTHQFVLNADGSAAGLGPSGELHLRFRTWKQDLRDHP